jgi:capsid protein
MNHRSRYNKKMAAAKAAIGEAVTHIAGQRQKPPKFYDLAGFDGANQSDRRGHVWWPSMSGARELTGSDRWRVMKKIRWLYANNGHARRVINGLANLIGYLSPQAITTDNDWNRVAEKHFARFAMTPFVFDRAGKMDFRTWQIANSRGRLKDGDFLSVLGQTTTGRAQLICYEATQIDNGTSTVPDNERLVDGVFRDRFGRHVAYSIVDPDQNERVARISAEDCIFYADFERPNQVRGYPALAHAVNDLLDIVEIDGETKVGIKRALYVGVYRKHQAANTGPMGLLSPVVSEDTGLDATIDGATKNIVQNVENILSAGGIPNLGQGESLETLADDRPGPNQREFVQALLEKIALGLGLPPSVVFSITGQTGPEVRFHMAELARWLAHEQDRLRRICQRYWVYFWAREFENGYPMPRTEEWWAAAWVPQADLTIDRGREGRLALEELRIGATTLADIYAAKGEDWEEKLELHSQILSRARDIAAGYGLSLQEIFPAWSGNASMATVAAAE